MTDKELEALFVARLDAMMPEDPVLSVIPGLTVAAGFQTRQQGKNDDACVYFFKIGDKRYGWKASKNTFVAPVPPDPVGTMTHTETQLYESTFQFMALAPQGPDSVTTESDILNLVAGIIASDANLAALQAQGVGILRVTDVRNPYFTDDRDRFVASPSFDVVFTHKRVRVSTDPVLVKYDAAVFRV